MKKVMFVILFVYLGLTSYAQNDTTAAKQFAERLNQLRKERGQKEFNLSFPSDSIESSRLYYSLETVIEKQFYDLEDKKVQYDSIRWACQWNLCADYKFKFYSFDIENMNDNELFTKYPKLDSMVNDTIYNTIATYYEDNQLHCLLSRNNLILLWRGVSGMGYSKSYLSGITNLSEVYMKTYTQKEFSEYNFSTLTPSKIEKLELKEGKFQIPAPKNYSGLVFLDNKGQILQIYITYEK